MPVPLDEAGKLLLPDNLIVGGDLDLSGTPIEALPENLTVGGNLDLRDTAITALPENLAIGGDLYILSDVEEIPATVKIGGKSIARNSPSIFDKAPCALQRGFAASVDTRVDLSEATRRHLLA
ncbi:MULTISPECIES: hypothetical protein [unclassified Bradyrhizobium]|uniref:hypothetical protein n=1 Tax=unclassified Bradyrhizobium TaxID=2631580 RepID=UPI0028E5431C|nr:MULTISPECIES: hypothetical protein [unclassified Bradyrhizobium]